MNHQETLVQEEREYNDAFRIAQDKGFPFDFNEFCVDFDNMIAGAILHEKLDEVDDE